MALEQGAGVLEVLFGVGLGGGDAVEGCVEDGDDAVLFFSGGRVADQKFFCQYRSRQFRLPAASFACFFDCFFDEDQHIAKEILEKHSLLRPSNGHMRVNRCGFMRLFSNLCDAP
jgi:hypothetical protein